MSNFWINFACLGSGCVFLWCRSRALMPYSLSFALIAFFAFLGEHMSSSSVVLKNLVSGLRVCALLALLLMIVCEVGKVTSKYSSLTHQLPIKYLAQWMIAGLFITALTFGLAMLLKENTWQESRASVSGNWLVGASTVLTLGVFWMACIGSIVPYFLGKCTTT
jgi:hypothetical protein